ncbi:MAG: hypothetical protein COA65_01480 [Rhodospirillaceae bacterium]|nr:MAG: hypothetical protein COA65_01480 [Rhodospirillaceae bacterium]
MSQADVERFVADLKTNPDLLTEVKENAGGIASVVEIAKGKGYDITLEEAKSYIQSQAKQELSDEQLDSVAGGKGHHHHHHHHGSTVTQTNTVQTAEAVTTAVEAAEVAVVAVVVLT